MPENKRLVARTCQMCGHQFEGTTKKAYCPDCVIVRRNASSNKSYYRSKDGLPNLREVENPGIYVHHGKYHARIVVDGAQYWLGTFADKDLCISMRREAENHVAAGDFDAWLNALKPSKRVKVGSSGAPGVTAIKDNGWKATVFVSGRTRSLGKFPTVEEAVERQKLAQQHINAGDFETWLDAIRDPLKGVYQEKNGKWTANIRLNGRRIRAGTFATVEEAVSAATNARATWRACPVCGNPVKDARSTCCSRACAGVYEATL